MGRPIITRPSHYRHQLAEALLAPGTFFDLDRDEGKIAKRILALTARPEELHDMGARMAARFREVVNYDREAGRIGRWIERLP
jgi:hypothetical protein